MPSLRSITIVELVDGTAAFQPDVPNAKPGQPLGVNRGDNVTWNNRTNKAHWPVAVDPPGFLTNDIPAGKVSQPTFSVDHTVKYQCRHHPKEEGFIVVVAHLTS